MGTPMGTIKKGKKTGVASLVDDGGCRRRDVCDRGEMETG